MHQTWKKYAPAVIFKANSIPHWKFFIFVFRRVHRGGSSPLAPPPWHPRGGGLPHHGIYGQMLKSGVVGKNKLALILKWVISNLVFPLYLKSPQPHLINNYGIYIMHYLACFPATPMKVRGRLHWKRIKGELRGRKTNDSLQETTQDFRE